MSSADIVIQTEHLSAEAADWLARRCNLVVCSHDDPKFGEVVAEARGLVVRTYTTVDQQLLDGAPKLKVVGRAGAGLDNIDVAACRARSIKVVYTPDANTQAVVEYVITLLSNALRPRVTLTTPVDSGDWKYLRAQTVGRRQMSDLTLGLLGLGRVGKRLAKAATAIGMNVIYSDLLEILHEQRFGARCVDVQQLFAESDVVSLHVDGRDSNRCFVDSELMSRMKPDVMFINTSRGFVVDSTALADFLRAHSHALAMLDVHDPEPFDSEYPLLGISNARLYPHLASRTEAAMLNMSWVVRDVVAVLEGEKPRYPAPPCGKLEHHPDHSKNHDGDYDACDQQQER